MKNGLYFWKSQRTPGKKVGVLIGVIVIILIGLAVGWYYLQYIPNKEAEKKLKDQKAALEMKIKQVNDFYLDKLSGGGIDDLVNLMAEMYKSDIPLNLTGYVVNTFSCGKDSCDFGYTLKENVIFNLQKKEVWGELYSASIGENDISFSDIPSKLNMNSLLAKYNAKEDINVPDCGDALGYLYSYNSTVENGDVINILKQPSSSVLEDETTIKGRKKYYGLLFLTWEVKTGYDISHIMSLFSRQAFKDDFIIKNINLDSGSVHISGDFVCKGGR